jgi:NAD(P)-dependent dehydrogenase (short-subunit alcohol dehydrogenase family)
MKKVLITGAGSGLGRGTAIGLAQAGHQVIATTQIWPQAGGIDITAGRGPLGLDSPTRPCRSEVRRTGRLTGGHPTARSYDNQWGRARTAGDLGWADQART